MIGFLVFLENKEDKEARVLGWASKADKILAEKSGFFDPVTWRVKLEGDAAKEAEARTQEIAGLEKRLATTPANYFKDIETIYARLKVLEPSNRTYGPKLEAAKRGYTTCTSETWNKGSALGVSQEFVRDRLKAPSTAEFPWHTDSVTWFGGCTFKVNSYVDAQNGFSAKIRTKYYAELEYLPDENKWRLKSLLM